MKLLLTGVAGFIGSHLAQNLLNLGYDVVGLDDLSTGSLDNINHLLDSKKFNFIEHDVREPISIEVDGVLNFACPASPKQYQADPVRTIETSFLGIINLLHLCKNQGAFLIQASTSEVYGDPMISPQIEEYWGNVNPIGIRSCYDEGKRAAETLCFDYKRQYSVDTRVLRIFNTYGPRMLPDDGRVVSNFIVQAIKGDDITIYGDGSQSRSFCYVDDLIKGISKLVQLDQSPATPINLGNPIEHSMLSLAKLIKKLVNSKSRIIYLDLPLDDPKQRNPNIDKAKSLLGWTPEVSLEIGLLRTIEYFKEVI